jgi:ribosomal protein S18 acetylase RimI-like enzyme
MNIIIRNSTLNDLDEIYNLHIKCFSYGDHLYKSILYQYVNKGFVIEIIHNTQKEIIGVLLEGFIKPYNSTQYNTNINYDNQDKILAFNDNSSNNNLLINNNNILSEYQETFMSINEKSAQFMKQNNHNKEYYGIIMLCINDNYRSKGLGTKLILKHLETNTNKQVCLHVRKSNTSAHNLYKNLGYEDIGFIKNKYIFPNEDAIFMIKNN